MKQAMKELQKLKGVGNILARRFIEAGYDTFAKIAATGEEGLRNIQGLNPRMVPSILAQAAELAGEAGKTRAEKVEELKLKAASMKEQVQDIALSVRNRFKEEATGKTGKKVEKEILKVISSLEKVESKLETKVKKTGKVLVKAEKRLAGLTETGLKGVGKGLKKARKSLERVFA